MSKAQDRDYKLISTAVQNVTAERDALRAERDALLAELAEYRTLRPVKCNPKCWRKGWEAARESAIEYYTRWTSDSGFVVKGISDGIRALVPPEPPSDCGQCNPLRPEAVDTCGACKNFKRCESLFGCKTDDTECDWYPSRFERA